MPDLNTIIDYYVNLLIIQYHDKPKAKATIALLAEQLLCDGIFFQIQDAFNLDTAVGNQLDILGKYLGMDRYFDGQDFDDNVYFGFTNADQDEEHNVTGFSSASDFFTKDGTWIGALEVVSSSKRLNDESYRILLKLKRIQNNSIQSNKSIDDSLFSLFGADVYAIDNYDMTMTYYVTISSSLYNLIVIANQKGVLLRPMGVAITDIIQI